MIVSQSDDGSVVRCLVRRLDGGELTGHCDACVKRHSITKLRCTMNGGSTWNPEPAFYVFATREIVLGTWRQIDASWRANNVGEETWQRVKERAPTLSGGFMEATV